MVSRNDVDTAIRRIQGELRREYSRRAPLERNERWAASQARLYEACERVRGDAALMERLALILTEAEGNA